MSASAPYALPSARDCAVVCGQCAFARRGFFIYRRRKPSAVSYYIHTDTIRCLFASTCDNNVFRLLIRSSEYPCKNVIAFSSYTHCNSKNEMLCRDLYPHRKLSADECQHVISSANKQLFGRTGSALCTCHVLKLTDASCVEKNELIVCTAAKYVNNHELVEQHSIE